MAMNSCVFFATRRKEGSRHLFWWWKARYPNEKNKAEGYWATFGTDAETGQPITTCDWIDKLAPKAWAVVAAGTCATYGGIHAMEGNPTGCMGLPDYLGWKWKSDDGHSDRVRAGMSGAARQFHRSAAVFAEYGGRARADDSAGRCFAADVAFRRDGARRMRPRRVLRAGAICRCVRREPTCIVKLGCWGPVVQCNVGKRGWMGGIGGCPNVGGICIGCTMPGFPDKFMPFMNQPPGSLLSSSAVMTYGRAIHALRRFTQASLNKEPPWRSHRRE